MGGAVGLHGTDGAATLAEARARGAAPQAGARARRALAALAAGCAGARVLAAGGPLGADAAEGLGLDVEIVGAAPAGETSAAETKAAARAMLRRGVAAILFAGGDGTARDLAEVVGLEAALLGIPCGVKMQSGVFATSPEAAGRLAADLLRDPARTALREVEVMDIDEDARRRGRLSARLYGYVRAPYARGLLQAAKAAPPSDQDAELAAACAETAREIAGDAATTWLIGPGVTAKRVLAALGLTGTLLGVDALRNGRIVGADVSAGEAMRVAGTGPMGVVVGVVGGQGFVFGRGNQQIGAEAIRRAWPDRLIVLAGAAKIAALPDPRLLVDTGDPSLDAAMTGYLRVRTGPRRAMLMRLEAG